MSRYIPVRKSEIWTLADGPIREKLKEAQEVIKQLETASPILESIYSACKQILETSKNFESELNKIMELSDHQIEQVAPPILIHNYSTCNCNTCTKIHSKCSKPDRRKSSRRHDNGRRSDTDRRKS